jgi:hypothetical protein
MTEVNEIRERTGLALLRVIARYLAEHSEREFVGDGAQAAQRLLYHAWYDEVRKSAEEYYSRRAELRELMVEGRRRAAMYDKSSVDTVCVGRFDEAIVASVGDKKIRLVEGYDAVPLWVHYANIIRDGWQGFGMSPFDAPPSPPKPSSSPPPMPTSSSSSSPAPAPTPPFVFGARRRPSADGRFLRPDSPPIPPKAEPSSTSTPMPQPASPRLTRLVWIQYLDKVFPQLWANDVPTNQKVIAEHRLTENERKLSFDDLIAMFPPPDVVGEVL